MGDHYADMLADSNRLNVHPLLKIRAMEKIIIISDKDESAEATKLCDELCEYKAEKSVFFGCGYYFHGELEDFWGYDLCTIVNWKDLDYITTPNFDPHTYANYCFLKPGIYDVEVVNCEKPCIGYFWIDERGGHQHMRGLICFKDDKEANDFALRKYSNKSPNL